METLTKTKITLLEFKNRLELLQATLIKEFYWLNRGGCGYFAKYMSDRLAQLGIKNEVYGLQEVGNSNFNKFAVKKYLPQMDDLIHTNKHPDAVDKIFNLADSVHGAFIGDHFVIHIKFIDGVIWFDGHRCGKPDGKTLVFDAINDRSQDENGEDIQLIYQPITRYSKEEVDLFASSSKFWNDYFEESKKSELIKVINTFTL